MDTVWLCFCPKIPAAAVLGKFLFGRELERAFVARRNRAGVDPSCTYAVVLVGIGSDFSLSGSGCISFCWCGTAAAIGG